MNKKINTVLFDLDGTLTNPREGIINSILYALDKLVIKEELVTELDTFIGPPLRDSFLTRYNLTEKRADEALELYREYFSHKGIYENKVYPGIKELLESLIVNKIKLFVATSKPTVFAEQILRYFELDKYFSGTIGSNLDNSRTDKTEIISYAISFHSLQTKNCVMVGDRKHDIIGAKNNSMKSIGVTYGFGTIEELLLHRPDFIANDCNELQSVILNLTTSL
jgi:phosphoglycolate phosphatase